MFEEFLINNEYIVQMITVIHKNDAILPYIFKNVCILHSNESVSGDPILYFVLYVLFCTFIEFISYQKIKYIVDVTSFQLI